MSFPPIIACATCTTGDGPLTWAAAGAVLIMLAAMIPVFLGIVALFFTLARRAKAAALAEQGSLTIL